MEVQEGRDEQRARRKERIALEASTQLEVERGVVDGVWILRARD